MDQDLRVDVTDADIAYARRLWRAALADDQASSTDRVTRLYEDLRRLVHAQAQQMAEEFRASRRPADDRTGATD